MKSYSFYVAEQDDGTFLIHDQEHAYVADPPGYSLLRFSSRGDAEAACVRIAENANATPSAPKPPGHWSYFSLTRPADSPE